MIVDAFTFFNELSLLELRLNTLKDVVDQFVLVEATRTFSGRNKPLIFAEHREHFRDFPIAHVVVSDMPWVGSAWVREAHQRNSILRGLESVPGDALIMVSDVDEISVPERAHELIDDQTLLFFEQDFFYYNMNLRARGKWFGTRACKCDALRRWTPQGVRSRGTRLVAGGWHFSYTGGVDIIIQKLGSFSHQEYNTPQYTNRQAVEGAVREGRDLFGRSDMQFDWVPGIAHLPPYVQQHPERFSSMLMEMATP